MNGKEKEASHTSFLFVHTGQGDILLSHCFLFCRWTVDDGSISVYNSFNEKTEVYNKSDVIGIRIYTRTYLDRQGPDDWGIGIEISMNNGEDFFFSYSDFQTMDEHIRGSITGMYQIKTSFEPSIITIDGKENVAYVVRDMHLNQEEIELLYLLFDANELPIEEK